MSNWELKLTQEEAEAVAVALYDSKAVPVDIRQQIVVKLGSGNTTVNPRQVLVH